MAFGKNGKVHEKDFSGTAAFHLQIGWRQFEIDRQTTDTLFPKSAFQHESACMIESGKIWDRSIPLRLVRIKKYNGVNFRYPF